MDLNYNVSELRELFSLTYTDVLNIQTEQYL